MSGCGANRAAWVISLSQWLVIFLLAQTLSLRTVAKASPLLPRSPGLAAPWVATEKVLPAQGVPIRPPPPRGVVTHTSTRFLPPRGAVLAGGGRATSPVLWRAADGSGAHAT